LARTGSTRPRSKNPLGNIWPKKTKTWPKKPMNGHSILKKWPDIDRNGKSVAKTGSRWPQEKLGNGQISAGLDSYWPQKLVIFPL
jgi:hypothetical protein